MESAQTDSRQPGECRGKSFSDKTNISECIFDTFGQIYILTFLKKVSWQKLMRGNIMIMMKMIMMIMMLVMVMEMMMMKYKKEGGNKIHKVECTFLVNSHYVESEQ